MCGDGGGGPGGGIIGTQSASDIVAADPSFDANLGINPNDNGSVPGFNFSEPISEQDFDSAIPVNKAFNTLSLTNPWGLAKTALSVFANPNPINVIDRAMDIPNNFSEVPMGFSQGAQSATDSANAALGRGGGSYGGGMDALSGGPGDAEGGGNAAPGAAPGVGGGFGSALASGPEFSAGKYYNRFSGEQLTPEQFMSKLNASKFMR